jgi:hypothetical protein
MEKRLSSNANLKNRNRPMCAPFVFGVLSFAFCLFLPGCYERKQAAVINPDGSGKIHIETVVVVPAQALPGQEKLNALSYGRLVAADLINLTRGVDAWADLSISEVDTPPGRAGAGGGAGGGPTRARIAATAYFKDLNTLRFDMLPLDFTWKRDPAGAAFTMQRTRTAVRSPAALSDADIQKLVAQSRDDYQKQKPVLELQLNAFSLAMSFDLPGEVSAFQIFECNANTVSLAIDGKMAMQALNRFMADDAALRATFQAGQDLPSNDDLMLDSMYGRKGPVQALVKIAPDAKPAFDYRTEMVVAQLGQAKMIADAKVELIPKFIVTTSTKPATPPATRGR